MIIQKFEKQWRNHSEHKAMRHHIKKKVGNKP